MKAFTAICSMAITDVIIESVDLSSTSPMRALTVWSMYR